MLVLLSDGVDSSSFHLREDVLELIDRSGPILTVFTIGFNLPEIGRSREGRDSQSTCGDWRREPTDATSSCLPGTNLDRVYRRIREMVDNEATLTVFDPDPDAEAGKAESLVDQGRLPHPGVPGARSRGRSVVGADPWALPPNCRTSSPSPRTRAT